MARSAPVDPLTTGDGLIRSNAAVIMIRSSASVRLAAWALLGGCRIGWDTGPVDEVAFANLREWIVDNQVSGDIVIGPGEPLSETSWTLVTVTKTVVETAPQALDAFFHQDAQANDCFLIDDIRLFRER